MSTAYRSAYEHIISTRLDELRDARERVAPLVPRLVSILNARLARSVGGAVAMAGALGMGLASLADHDEATPTFVLLGSTIAGVTTYLAARFLFAVARRAPEDSPFALVGEVTTDLRAIEASQAHTRLQQRLAKVEGLSVGLPLAALSLLAPLTLHWLFDRVASNDSAASFAAWIRISLVIVGHAHLALMVLSLRYARKLSRLSDEEIASLSVTSEWARTFFMTVLVAAIPGAFLFLVPPLLTAITGIVFIPAMFIYMRRRLVSERAAIALTLEAAQRSWPADPA